MLARLPVHVGRPLFTRSSCVTLGATSLLLAFGCGGGASAPNAPPPSGLEPPGAVEGAGSATSAGETAAPASGEQAASSGPSGTPVSGASTSPTPSAPPDPYADLPHPAQVDSGRSQLEASDVRDTVEAYRPHLRKTCWEPRVNAKADGAETVRVAVEAEVSAGGEVKGVRVAGGKGYEGLAGCVQDHVRHWQFPRAAKGGSLMFPIVFNKGEATYVQMK